MRIKVKFRFRVGIKLLPGNPSGFDDFKLDFIKNWFFVTKFQIFL